MMEEREIKGEVITLNGRQFLTIKNKDEIDKLVGNICTYELPEIVDEETRRIVKRHQMDVNSLRRCLGARRLEILKGMTAGFNTVIKGWEKRLAAHTRQTSYALWQYNKAGVKIAGVQIKPMTTYILKVTTSDESLVEQIKGLCEAGACKLEIKTKDTASSKSKKGVNDDGY